MKESPKKQTKKQRKYVGDVDISQLRSAEASDPCWDKQGLLRRIFGNFWLFLGVKVLGHHFFSFFLGFWLRQIPQKPRKLTFKNPRKILEKFQKKAGPKASRGSWLRDQKFSSCFGGAPGRRQRTKGDLGDDSSSVFFF